MKSISLYILLVFSLLNCTNSDLTQNTVKDALVKKMLNNPSLDAAKNQQGQLIILKNDYCENFDCDNYFKGFEDKVIFYGLEDIFMRGKMYSSAEYVIITKINEREKYMDLTKTTDWKNIGRGLRIQL